MQDFFKRRSLDMFSILSSSAAYDMNHSTDRQKKYRKDSSKGNELSFSELLNNRMEEIAVKI